MSAFYPDKVCSLKRPDHVRWCDDCIATFSKYGQVVVLDGWIEVNLLCPFHLFPAKELGFCKCCRHKMKHDECDTPGCKANDGTWSY